MSILLTSLRERQIGREFNKHHTIFELEAESYYSKKDEFKECEFQLDADVRTTFITEISPDGRTVACTHGDHSISIVSLRTLKVQRKLVGHPRSPWSISWGPKTDNGYVIASGCLAGYVYIWFENGDRLSWNCGKHTAIASLTFHPSELILIIAYATTLKIWDLRLPAPSVVLLASEHKIRYVTFDNYGNRLIAGIKRHEGTTQDLYNLRIWDFTSTDTPLDLDDSELVAADCKLHNDSLVAINNNFTMLATLIIPEISNPLKQPKLVGIYNLVKGHVGEQIHCIQLFTFGAVSLSFSPTSNYLLIGFNMMSGSFAQIFNIRKKRHMNSYPSNCIQFTKTPEFTVEFYRSLIQHEMRSFLRKNCNVRDYICICTKNQKHLKDSDEITCRYYPDLLTKIVRKLYEVPAHFKLNCTLMEIGKDMKDIHEKCLDTSGTPNTDTVKIRKYISLCCCLDNALNYVRCPEQEIRTNCVRWAKHIENGIIVAFSKGNIIKLL